MHISKYIQKINNNVPQNRDFADFATFYPTLIVSCYFFMFVCGNKMLCLREEGENICQLALFVLYKRRYISKYKSYHCVLFVET